MLHWHPRVSTQGCRPERPKANVSSVSTGRCTAEWRPTAASCVGRASWTASVCECICCPTQVNDSNQPQNPGFTAGFSYGRCCYMLLYFNPTALDISHIQQPRLPSQHSTGCWEPDHFINETKCSDISRFILPQRKTVVGFEWGFWQAARLSTHHCWILLWLDILATVTGVLNLVKRGAAGFRYCSHTDWRGENKILCMAADDLIFTIILCIRESHSPITRRSGDRIPWWSLTKDICDQPTTVSVWIRPIL